MKGCNEIKVVSAICFFNFCLDWFEKKTNEEMISLIFSKVMSSFLVHFKIKCVTKVFTLTHSVIRYKNLRRFAITGLTTLRHWSNSLIGNIQHRNKPLKLIVLRLKVTENQNFKQTQYSLNWKHLTWNDNNLKSICHHAQWIKWIYSAWIFVFTTLSISNSLNFWWLIAGYVEVTTHTTQQKFWSSIAPVVTGTYDDLKDCSEIFLIERVSCVITLSL